MTKIAIAEYESDFSDAIMSVFANEPEINIEKTCSSGKELLKYISNNPIDGVLMDHRMPDIGGVEATKLIKKAYPQIKILMLSFHINEYDVKNAMDAGADGYLSKNISKSEIMYAIECLKNNQPYFSEKVHQMYLRNRLSKENSGVVDLTPREKEILPMLGNGLTSEQIASTLFLGATTVNTHRKNLLKKFDVKNNAELMKQAVLGGYITD